MKAYFNNLLDRLEQHVRHFTDRFGTNATLSKTADERPLRAELFSALQMEQHGKLLATDHQINLQMTPDQLLPRLADNERVLMYACNLLIESVKSKRQITPAAEWLLDNFYLIEEQIRTAKRHLPKNYSMELPRLLKGSSAGFPRVYDIALETISHGDARVDPENLSRFVAAYQKIMPLKMGELWAIPIMLRLALIDNLRRVAARLAIGSQHRNLADSWADQMTEVVETDPSSLILVIADMARSDPPMVGSFVAELARRLQGQGPALALPLTWIEQRLLQSGDTVEQLVLTEIQQQAADQVSISNSIGSLRFLATMNWREFFETMSIVEQTLQTDPLEVYGKMDFGTRDQYRHSVEHIAKHSHLTEFEVAQQAVALAQEAAARLSSSEDSPESSNRTENNNYVGNIDPRKAHIGYYLIDEGLLQIEKIAAVRSHGLDRFRKSASRMPLRMYLGGIAILTTLLTAGLLYHVYIYAYPLHARKWELPIIAVLALIATSHLALALVNWLATLLAKPQRLPRMDFSEGIPGEARTLVAVPSMLMHAEGVDDLCEALEVRFLANRDPHLHFCLLTDFRDASTESQPEDTLLLQIAEQRINELNEKYNPQTHNTFFLFHRPRRWNPQENIWMGYERKRGKLAQLNAYLRGAERSSFMRIVGKPEVLSNIKYVITLDTDTLLPRDVAWQLSGAMAHPLNTPFYDPALHRVTAGYAILQPRIANSLPGSNTSYYARLYGGESGIDPYTRAVSDVYQDLFKEGSFIGKGIYDVDAFEHALTDRLPENQILSHDLLEGCYARSGLLSDIQLYEEYPNRYGTDVSRRHRWIRGDWQIAGWLRPRVPASDKSTPRQPNFLSTLSHWKIFDNLRRSLIPSALFLLLILGWTIFNAPLFWTVTVIGIIVLPYIIGSILDLLRKPKDVLLRQHLKAVFDSVVNYLIQALLTLAFLPYEACYSIDAILRTIWRMLISHRRMLEWNPSSEISRHSANDIFSSFRAMWMAPLLAVAIAVIVIVTYPRALFTAAPLLVLWIIGPAIAWRISLPQQPTKSQLTREQYRFLRNLTRKTWAFFETYVGPEDNWLPPDNVQEQPVAVVAHRTSPTNIGMALLANLAAHDFGYILIAQLLERTDNTVRTLLTLERYRGHFYNWYDTQYLKPLQPMYVSTVDSGNLAGHLLTLQAGLNALNDQPIIGHQWLLGLWDTLSILGEAIDAAEDSKDKAANERIAFHLELASACASPPISLNSLQRMLERLTDGALAIESALHAGQSSEISWWSRTLVHHCREASATLAWLTPWMMLPQHAHRMTELPHLNHIPTLRDLLSLETRLQEAEHKVSAALTENDDVLMTLTNASGIRTAEKNAQLTDIYASVAVAAQRASKYIKTIERLTLELREMAQMEYEFLYDRASHLLAIGYNVSERRRDASYYDLLASEARLCSFVAIAQGQLPQENWFSLGRQLTTAGGAPILLSWSGSMFEYLMPLLVMPTFANTLLDQTYRSAVKRQIDYGAQIGMPWGISESGYNAFDANLNYQYRAFGVPGLGLKRGLADDQVIAPYASVLALMVAPEQACVNLQRLTADGFQGKYGMYEAVDYTRSRLPRGQSHALIRSFMAHHQGMSLLALTYLLLDQPMQQRFGSDPLFQATMLLLHERVPKASAFYSNSHELAEIRTVAASTQEMPVRILGSANTLIPEVQLLSNGRYHVMVSNAGGGASRWRDLAVSRWHEDTTCDNWGTFCYVRDLISGTYWSSTFQPTRKLAQDYEVIFSEGRAEFRRRDSGEGYDIEMHTEIVVSPEDDIELRRTRITNRSRNRRSIDITSYSEVVLAPAAADSAHPAFSNLFVQTEILPDQRAILCTRRPRSIDEKMPWMFHLMAAHGAKIDIISYETDRMQFIGRGRSINAPQAMLNQDPLSGSQGSVLDPVVAIRYRITLAAEQTVTIDMVTGASETRDVCLTLIDKYQDRHLADRVFDLSWTHSQVILRQINATETDAQLYGRLANSIIYANSALRADASILIKNTRGQSGLWSYAISGDLPIVLLQIKDVANIELVRQLVQAHSYWRLKGLAVDLVIWNEDHAGYRQLLQDQIMGLIAAGIEGHVIDRPGGIFVRPGDQIANEDRILLHSVARIVLTDSGGTLAEQINRRSVIESRVPRLTASRSPAAQSVSRSDNTNQSVSPLIQRSDLILTNPYGGFTPDGREYMITTGEKQQTPAPWVNVLANAEFGTIVSENGIAYTWGENAHEFRLTPWHNDPVSASSGEAFFLRDEETTEYWSPTPLLSTNSSSHGAANQLSTPYVTRHGFGYSVFEHIENGIASALWVYVATDDSVKFSVLKLRNDSGRTRKLSATGYVEWVLGDLREKSMMHVVTEVDPNSGAIFAQNAYNTEFNQRVAFFDVDDPNRTLTGDRTEFLGRNGSLQQPQALERTHLSGKVGAGLDPCAALQVPFTLADGENRQLVFMLGLSKNGSADASALVRKLRGTAAAQSVLDAVHRYWDQTLGAVQIDTPDPALNVLTNGWLIYQTIACRLWARSGYYQSGGAFGFRDQLQDVMALVHTQPHLLRAHLLLCAAHQFVEGDVLHWWHPPSDRGVRTKCSDDFLWLPLATCRYIIATGDTNILDEVVPFIEGRLVGDNEDSYYDLPTRSSKSASLYQHCTRAITHGLRFGSHGLPLIGSCDWNDGMDKVGEHGRGESVWLGWFLYDVLTVFSGIAMQHGDTAFSDLCTSEAQKLQTNIETNAWDGNWYRRAYFDDGTPLGSVSNPECQIDAISQSWAVISGAGNPERSQKAMDAVDQRLVRRDAGLIQLLDPPFDKSPLNPGYIRGYAPGVRENGGQYTHAAIWTVMAFATLGDHRRAWELLALINPINHGQSAEKIAIYKVEPYVISADVYGVAPHIGRGGWSWYTGSSGWMYRLITESLLGLKLEKDQLSFNPCMPAEWSTFSMRYRYGSTPYQISITQHQDGEAAVSIDGMLHQGSAFTLADDQKEHVVDIRIVRAAAALSNNDGNTTDDVAT
ncbi:MULTISPECIES: glucoamylase family protein [unclassified Glaciimonas]|uniref:GH36-type glycosyl hydrolase domain-containing protein n=2 Tax=unclassified Glaciimonas TaxID=2644401 RepID=UPI002B228F75|nr:MULTISPECIES: glucoamylase family protein [unclassified Glaciimonas]